MGRRAAPGAPGKICRGPEACGEKVGAGTASPGQGVALRGHGRLLY